MINVLRINTKTKLNISQVMKSLYNQIHISTVCLGALILDLLLVSRSLTACQESFVKCLRPRDKLYNLASVKYECRSSGVIPGSCSKFTKSFSII